jgi:hypothetical protein
MFPGNGSIKGYSFASDSSPVFSDIHTELAIQKVKVKVTLRLAVYRQSVRLGVKPLENYDHIFFQLNSCGNSPYVTSSLTLSHACNISARTT